MSNQLKGDSQILDRIRKLLALAESPNEHEAAVAAAKAADLMREHGVSLEAIGDASPRELGRESVDFQAVHKAAWKWQVDLGDAVARVTDCEFLFIGRDGARGFFYGSTANAKVAREMHIFLQSALIVRAVKVRELRRKAKQPLGSNFLKWFLHGAVTQVSYRLSEQKRAAKEELRNKYGEASQRYELARADDAKAALAELGPKVVKEETIKVSGYGNPLAEVLGHAAGSEVALGNENVLPGNAPASGGRS